MGKDTRRAHGFITAMMKWSCHTHKCQQLSLQWSLFFFSGGSLLSPCGAMIERGKEGCCVLVLLWGGGGGEKQMWLPSYCNTLFVMSSLVFRRTVKWE